MAREWDDMEGVDAAERILRNAICSGAKELRIHGDGEGAMVLFVVEEEPSVFDHIPVKCRDAVFAYLLNRAAIDGWKTPPASGFGLFAWDGDNFQLEVRLEKGERERNLRVLITPE